MDPASQKARKPVSVEEIDAQIARLKEKRKQLQEQRATRIGKAIIRAAEESGLADLEIPGPHLRQAFAEIAARFHPPGPDPQTSPPA